MPLFNGAGYGDTTQGKQDDFRDMIALHINIVDRITEAKENQWRRRYTYIDTNAGPGFYKGLTGSPLHFLDEIEKTTIPYKAIFVEKEIVNAQSLDQIIQQRSLRHPPTIINDCNENALRSYVRENQQATYGMIYHDPNGEPSFDLLAEVSKSPSIRIMDIMISVGACLIKRKRGEEKSRKGYTDIVRFNDGISTINKTTWIIRKPQGSKQWTFAIGSNWSNFPDWKKRGFYRLDSEMGQAILHELTYTDEERNAMSGQQSFFDLPELQTHPTEHTKNT